MNQKKYNLVEVDINKYPVISNYFSEVKKIMQLTQQKEYSKVFEMIIKVQKDCNCLKDNAIEQNDEKTADIAFLLGKYVFLLKSIATFWKICDSKDYQVAWNSLQDGIDAIRTLTKFMEDDSFQMVNQIGNYLENIEKLYPFALFCSMEAVNKSKVCSICGKSPFDMDCKHIAGDLYMGEMAYITIENVEFLGFSFVKNPMDKKCIIQMNCDTNNIENTPFKLIHSLIQSIEKPYHFFDLKLETRSLPRSYYSSWSDDSLCPCGSEKKFKECCSNKDVIENPHYIIISKGILKID